MSIFAILMFFTLSVALIFGVFQVFKTSKKLPEDTSDLNPDQSLQKMDAATPGKQVRGTKKDPLKG